jgi:hypothetical protein
VTRRPPKRSGSLRRARRSDRGAPGAASTARWRATSLVVFGAELYGFATGPIDLTGGSSWARALALVAGAGLLAVAAHEHLAARASRHAWTVGFALLTIPAALLALAAGSHRAVDVVGCAGIILNALLALFVRRRP